MATGDIVSVTIRADGWSADVVQSGDCTAGTYAFGLGTNNADLANAKFLLTVTSEGYNASGVLGTIERLVYGTAIVRKPYPDHATLDQTYDGTTNTTSRIALSDFVYDDDKDGGAGTSGVDVAVAISGGWCTVGGTPQSVYSGTATNSSTVDYPKVIGHFAVEQRRPVNGTQAIEVVAFHKFGMNGKPVARVAITATGATSANAESGAATSMSKSARADSLPVYAVSLDLSTTAGFTRGEGVDINFKAYPWVGDAASVLDSLVDKGDVNFKLDDLHWTIMDAMIAVVDSATGNDTTGVASAVQATADAAPCATVDGALTKIAAANNTAHSLNRVDGGQVQLKAGSYQWTKAGTQGSTNGYWSLMPHSTTNRAGVIIDGYSGTRTQYLHQRWYNLTITRTSNVYLVGGANGGTFVVESVNMADAHGQWYSGTASSDIEFLDCTSNNGNFSRGGNDGHARLIRNHAYTATTEATTPPVGNASCVLGFRGTGGSKGTWKALASSGLTNYIVAYCTHYSVTDGTMIGNDNDSLAISNCAFVGNILERIGASSSSLGSIGTQSTSNILLHHNTFAGQRFNHENDIVTAFVNATATNWSMKFNSFNARGDHRADIFDEDASMVGTWTLGYSVGCFGNHNEAIAYAGDTDFWGLASNTDTGTSIDPSVPAGYVSDKSRGGTDAGNGDYKPATGSVLLNRIPAGAAVIPYDLSGAAIPNDGTGDAGALQDDLAVAPTVTTTAASSVTATSAVLGGEVTDPDSLAGDCGIVWNTTGAPNVVDDAARVVQIGNGAGAFSDAIAGLPADTLIYWNTWVDYGETVVYGTADDFTTLQDFSASIAANGRTLTAVWTFGTDLTEGGLEVDGTKGFSIVVDGDTVDVTGYSQEVDGAGTVPYTATLTVTLATPVSRGATVTIGTLEAGYITNTATDPLSRAIATGTVVTNNSTQGSDTLRSRSRARTRIR